jgi:hypothetical protein
VWCATWYDFGYGMVWYCVVCVLFYDIVRYDVVYNVNGIIYTGMYGMVWYGMV